MYVTHQNPQIAQPSGGSLVVQIPALQNVLPLRMALPQPTLIDGPDLCACGRARDLFVRFAQVARERSKTMAHSDTP